MTAVPFLCNIPLNPLRRGTQALLSSPERVHAAVEGVLPPEGRQGRLLWRVEPAAHQVNLLILSPERPSLHHLVEQAGWEDSPAGAPTVADLNPLLGQLGVGRRFHFRCRLNPIRNVPVPGSRGTRRGQGALANQFSWFARRATGDELPWGFSVGGDAESATAQIVERSQLRFSRSKGAPPVVLDTATFQGVLTVTDADAMRRSLIEGIGRGKAYGCGLLTLAQVVDGVVAR